MNREPIDLQRKLALFTEQWRPKVIAEMNDYQFKLVKLEKEFVWHQHDDTGEVFLVVEGTRKIAFGDGEVEPNAGEMYVVPKGVEHKPSAVSECKVMLIEPKGVLNTGDAMASDTLTAPMDVWI